jgi:hypothetical protein
MKKKIFVVLVCLLVASLCVIAVGAQKDAQSIISLPKALVEGHSYTLQFPEMSLTVNGQAVAESFVAEGTEATLVYTDSTGAQIGSYTLPIVDTNGSLNHCAYFYDETGKVTVKENKDDISLSFFEDAEISFINLLSADEFAIQFSEQTTKFEAITLKLTDEKDKNVSLTFVMDVAQKTVSVNGQQAPLGDNLRLKYRDVSRIVTNYDDQELIACATDDNGQPFNGFTGGVYLTIGFRNVTGSSVIGINRLNNQALGHKDSADADISEPQISILSALSSKQEMNETFVFPQIAAYDVLSAITETTVTVEAPDGTEYTEPFTISQYGRYKMLITAKDSCGNKVKVNKVVFVNDNVAPTLTVNALSETEYKVGDTVTVPTYTATDNMENLRVDVILILPDAQVRLLISDLNGEITYALTDASLYNSTFRVDNTSFRAEQKGTYTLRYVVNDEQYNRAVQELTFTVS